MTYRGKINIERKGDITMENKTFVSVMAECPYCGAPTEVEFRVGREDLRLARYEGDTVKTTTGTLPPVVKWICDNDNFRHMLWVLRLVSKIT